MHSGFSFLIFLAKNQLEHPVVFSKRGFLTENHFLSSLVGTATSQDNHPSITFFRHFFTELSNVSTLNYVPNRHNVLISVFKSFVLMGQRSDRTSMSVLKCACSSGSNSFTTYTNSLVNATFGSWKKLC